ncbi:MAG: prenyltransferase/squalene oxidase repeat-containing protein [Planctomycetota bacterium]
MRNNLVIVVLLILIAGIIIGVSVIITRPAPGVEKESVAKNVSQLPAGLPTASTGQVGDLCSDCEMAPPKTLPPSANQISLFLEKTFNRGLGWVMSKQLNDGSWPDPEGKSDAAMTAMALISACHNTSTEYRQTYQTQIEKGIQYLLKRQQPDGSIIDPGKFPAFATYKTPLALMALVAADKEKYKDVIIKARNYLAKAQYVNSSESWHNGGWGYQERGGEVKPNPNMSVLNQVAAALHEGGLPKDNEVWARAVEFTTRCQNSSETNKFQAVVGNDGGVFYSPMESKAGEETLADGRKTFKSYASMTYAGLLSFIYADVDKNNPRVRAVYAWIQAHYNLDENIGLRTDARPELGKQGLFYYYHTFAKALDAYGEKIIITKPDNAEHFWAKDLTEKLAARQQENGTWVNDVDRWMEGYDLLTTCYSLMALDICRKWVQ